MRVIEIHALETLYVNNTATLYGNTVKVYAIIKDFIQ